MQQESKMFDKSTHIVAARHAQDVAKKFNEYQRLVDRFPEGVLSGDVLDECKAAFRDLMPCGHYRDPDGLIVRVDQVDCAHGRERARDFFVVYTTEGRSDESRLPVLFFIEMHKFAWHDLAS